MNEPDGKPKIAPPTQARPVHQGDWGAQSAHGTDGIQPAKSPCSDLHGLAQKLCYARYGISVDAAPGPHSDAAADPL
ncbi:hypothetical protein MOQ72_43275 [Saccharopolyspora sp. K220]|uniref:hypothetical protein n=1 Tax=Saccharopolyspora soli TaxID=2926618 RepID=UPI001F591369|nr:hypothetical protein [Saccharopolyspora soli]MCI2424236.1 hypothetical protein [Saccharopolyspora soli]